MIPEIEIPGQIFAHFSRFQRSFLTTLGVKKSFSRLFRSCLQVFQELLKHCCQILILFAAHCRPFPLGSRGCSTQRKIHRILIRKKITPPPSNHSTYWMGGGVGLFTFPYFFWEKTRGFFSFFNKCLQLSGKRSFFFCSTKKPKIGHVD